MHLLALRSKSNNEQERKLLNRLIVAQERRELVENLQYLFNSNNNIAPSSFPPPQTAPITQPSPSRHQIPSPSRRRISLSTDGYYRKISHKSYHHLKRNSENWEKVMDLLKGNKYSPCPLSRQILGSALARTCVSTYSA
mmetsp:Transcript_15211/g.34055  ORF Transcript_15211/g.34055 Transcript_15211/m.34055 type:complete len:139 (+) Transcript_15211:419-835(+)